MYTTIEDALNELKQGKIIIVVDETREKESDLLFAAEFVDAEKITFMINYTSGIITVPITQKRAEELELPLMVQNNSDKHCTNFTVSADANDDEMTTGVSTIDRTMTIKRIVYGSAANLSRPGHIFPLIAKDSLFERQGHTEAAITLCTLAGLQKVGVISELMNKDGMMMDNKQVADFGEKNKIRIISVAQIMIKLKEDINT